MYAYEQGLLRQQAYAAARTGGALGLPIDTGNHRYYQTKIVAILSRMAGHNMGSCFSGGFILSSYARVVHETLSLYPLFDSLQLLVCYVWL
jgi:hypothetical protein